MPADAPAAPQLVVAQPVTAPPIPTAPVEVPAPGNPAHTPPGSQPPQVKPEPRQLPNRPHPVEVVAKQMPEAQPSRGHGELKAAPLPRHPHSPRIIFRFAMLGLFLLASAALVFGVLTLLKMQTEKEDPTIQPPANTQSNPSAKPQPSGPAQDDSPAEEMDSPPELPPHPAPVPPAPTLIEPAPDLPEGMEPKAPGMAALEVLEKFLAAKSLEERMPMIETKTPPGELAMSCLAGPLPSAPKMLLEFQESNPLEELVDLYYSVDFQTPDRGTVPQTILVRTRGRGEPKVVVDPFLDLFGGRLAAYASKPTEDAGIFQVIASALATCTDPKVPGRDKKLTLKLLPRDNTKEIAEAYFGKMSKISEMLEDGTYSLSYGKAKACTVMLRWNTEDDVNYPYLEAIAIKSLDWNP